MSATEQARPVPAGADGVAAGPDLSYTHRQIMIIMSGLLFGLLLAALDQTIVTTALTRISEDFHRQDLYSWVVTSYLLTSCASTPLYGKISDQYGRKRIFQAAIVIFLVGSALSGLSQSMYQLIVFRGLQGIGAGGLMTLTMAIVADIIPMRERGRYQGYFGAVLGLSNVLGPLVGGLLVDHASWRWVFYVNIPIGLVALVVINRVLHLDYHPRRTKIDVVGALLIVSGVSLFLVGVQIAGTSARMTSTSYAYGIAGILLVLAFIWWESRIPEPIIPLRLFKNKAFAVANLLGFITGSIMFGAIIFLPQYFQYVRGNTPTIAGFRLLPLLAGMLLTSITSGRLISRFGRYKIFINMGLGVLAVGMFLLTLVTITTAAWPLVGIMFVIGFGLGLFMQTLVLVVQNAVPPDQIGVGTASVTFFRTLGGAIGSAVLGAVLVLNSRNSVAHYTRLYGARLGPLHSFVHGMNRAFLYTLPVAVLAFLLSFMLREVRLRSSLGPATPAATAPAGAAPPAPPTPATPPTPAGAAPAGAAPAGATSDRNSIVWE
jgi:EmrB/QacA subfamily drug resistance transporter